MNRWLKAINLSLLAVLLLTHCTGNGDSASTDRQEAEVLATSSSESPVLQDSTAAPARLIRAGGQAVPVYEDFAGLAPIFEKQNDTTYVINFWATWCKPCVEELPYFEQLHERFAGEKLRVILISLDFERDLDTKLKQFVEQNQLKSDVMVLLDGSYNEWIDKVDASWGGAIPVTVIYNANDRQFVGQQLPSYEQLESIVSSVL